MSARTSDEGESNVPHARSEDLEGQLEGQWPPTTQKPLEFQGLKWWRRGESNHDQSFSGTSSKRRKISIYSQLRVFRHGAGLYQTRSSSTLLYDLAIRLAIRSVGKRTGAAEKDCTMLDATGWQIPGGKQGRDPPKPARRSLQSDDRRSFT